jgi:Fe-S-cluster containining protein
MACICPHDMGYMLDIITLPGWKKCPTCGYCCEAPVKESTKLDTEEKIYLTEEKKKALGLRSGE